MALWAFLSSSALKNRWPCLPLTPDTVWRHLWHHIVLEGHLPWEGSGLGYVYFFWALKMGRDWTCVAEKCASGAALTSSTHEPDTRAGNNCTLYLLPEFTTSVTCCSWKWTGMGTWVGKANRYKVFLYCHLFFYLYWGIEPRDTHMLCKCSATKPSLS